MKTITPQLNHPQSNLLIVLFCFVSHTTFPIQNPPSSSSLLFSHLPSKISAIINKIFNQPSIHLHGNDGSSSLACLHHRCDGICLYGGIGRRSLSALTLKINDDTTQILNAHTTVLRFHATGVAHHPPAGDHTCCFVLLLLLV